MIRSDPMVHFRTLACLVLAVLTAACGGGGGGGGGALVCTTSQTGLCLIACNLGCTQGGCGSTEIAQNQVLSFTFNRPLDLGTVAAGGLALASTNGEAPGGTFFVSGSVVTFVPEAKAIGGSTLFGFRANDTYRLEVRGQGEDRALKAVSGEVLGAGFSCVLRVSRGIIDADGKPPVAELVSPALAARGNAPRDGVIALAFSELVDLSGFSAANSAASPVVFRLRKTRLEASARVCDSAASTVLLEGSLRCEQDAATQRTLVTMTPALQLPIACCVEVEISERVKDLAGTPAAKSVLSFVTSNDPPRTLEVLEPFSDSTQIDLAASSGTWGGGALVPGLIGGDGLHGDFDLADGTLVAPDHYVWSTDSQPIRAPVLPALTPPLSPVTDGVFRFASMRIPKGVTVEFRGRNPARVLVAGNLEIEGRLVLNGAAAGEHDGTLLSGQAGASGGPGAGRGGQGGDLGDGLGNGAGAYSGKAGGNVSLAAGHAYASRADLTGGRGAAQYPTSGRNSDVTYGWSFGQFCAMVPAGGGGGGNGIAGTAGIALASPTNELGPVGAAGLAFDPFPLPQAASSLDHFMVGGSGGGAGGSHAMLSTKGAPGGPRWFSGAGGAGGGGALALRVGRDLAMRVGSRVEARGGSGFVYTLAAIDHGPPAPGGGGSGGSVLLQVGGVVTQFGTIDTSGGTGSRWELAPTLPMGSRGGDGAVGHVRLEMPANPGAGALGSTIPPATVKNVDILRDRDLVVGARSLWYSTRQAFPPAWLHYLVVAEVGGNPRTFSDDPAQGAFAGYGSGEPITVLVQGATVSPAAGSVQAGSERAWRDRVGPGVGQSLAGDGCNGVRFLILFDKRLSSAVRVKRVQLGFREQP